MAIPIQLKDEDHALIEALKKELGLKTKTETVHIALERQLEAVLKEKQRAHFRKNIHETYDSSRKFMEEVKNPIAKKLARNKFESKP